jgi:elongation factor P
MRTSAGNIKKGEFILHQGEIYQVAKAEFYSPGKGSALMKTRMKSVLSGKNVDTTYKSNEDVETVDVSSIEMQYLYKDAENYYFMEERSYNQYHVPASVIGEIGQFFKEGNKYYVYVHNDVPLSVRPPMSVRLRVTETEDAAKGDTVSGAKKAAIVETGARVMVPLFVKLGEIIVVNPETGEYVERVKE